jgi:hypothetical protein
MVFVLMTLCTIVTRPPFQQVHISCFWCFEHYLLFYKTGYLNEEFNRTEHSTSVGVPCYLLSYILANYILGHLFINEWNKSFSLFCLLFFSIQFFCSFIPNLNGISLATKCPANFAKKVWVIKMGFHWKPR